MMDRRHFFKYIGMGGVATLTAGGIWSCDNSTDPNNTDQSLEDSIAAAREGAEFEAMAIQTYLAAAGSGLITDQNVLDLAIQYNGHHETHLEEFNKVLVALGQTEVDLANAQPDPGVGSVTNQTEVLTLAMTVEFAAAGFYFSGIVNRPLNSQVRKVFANILPIEVAHTMVYKEALGRLPSINGGIFEQLSLG
jgi:rubrerythrin